MIKQEDLQEAIAECQGIKNPNANTCIKLAAYYTIMEHLYDRPSADDSQSYSFAASHGANLIEYAGESEFSKIISRKSIDEILPVIDELMDTLKILNPRLYEGVITKLSI